ncbi:MAG: hypothetical protein KDI98_07740 [Hyphomicrobiaceae bacterium]|nr:hypothetical protein [Hyphomicrobiaceae bacterium]
MAGTRRDRALFWLALSLAGIALFAVFPLLLSFAAREAGDALGCDLRLVAPGPCEIFGLDAADGLGQLYDFGFAVLLTWPIAGIAFCAWLVVFVAIAGRRLVAVRRERNRQE